jgi:hypothetical protein
MNPPCMIHDSLKHTINKTWYILLCKLCAYKKSDFLKLKNFTMQVKYFTLQACVDPYGVKYTFFTQLSNLHTCRFYTQLLKYMTEQCQSSCYPKFLASLL